MNSTLNRLGSARGAFALAVMIACAALPAIAMGSASSRIGSTMPVWSADGTKIAFVSDRTGSYEVYAMNTDGSRQTQLTRLKQQCLFPAWSPDSRKLVFASKIGGHYQLDVVGADGSGVRRLTRSSADDIFPGWSPDGRRVLFRRLLGGTDDRRTRIEVVNADGTSPRSLTPMLPGGNAVSGPAWSPDGRRIAYDRKAQSFVNQIFVMDADGSHQRQLTRGRVSDRGPAWSPDGRAIAFASSGRDPGVYVMHSDGSKARRLTRIASGGLFDAPVWSPDGRRIAFYGGSPDVWLTDDRLYVTDRDGSSRRLLVQNHDGVGSMVWSPDGRKVAYVLTHADQVGDIYLVNRDGSDQHPLTSE